MGKTFLKETAQLLQAKRRKKRWTRTVISLSLVVALVTSSLLSHPAITMESTTTCGMGEHAHTADCYQRQLICGQEERAAVPATEEKVLNCSTEVHEHTDGCKDAEGNLICGKEAHTHGDNCYQTVTTPGVEGHSHSDACYQSVLTCNLPEHTHSDSCYPQTEAAPAAETVPVTEAQTAAAAEAQTQATEAQTQATEAQTQPATPAQTETIPSETAAQTESETEKVTEKETEKKWSAQELKASGSDYKITVKAPASAKIPDNAVLKVKELKKDTTPQDYAQYTQLAANKAAQQMAKDILYGRYFDLTIEADGKEIQPSDKVTVTLTYSNAVEAKAEIEVKAVYFGDQTELLNVKTNSNGQTWTEAKVEVKKMTVLAVAGVGIEETEAAEVQSETEAVTEASTETELETEVSTETETEVETETETEVSTEIETETETETEVSTEVETETETETETEVETETETETETEIAPLTLTAEGSDYTIEVSYTAEAEIPEGAQLSVREIAAGTEEYDSYYQQALAAVQEGDTTTLSFARFFDISFVLDGAEIEPKAPVSVKVSYTNAVEVPEESDVKSVHFGDTAEVLEVQTNAADGAMNEVTFEAESFSVYAVVGINMEAAAEYTAGKLTFSGEGYQIELSYEAEAEIPEGAEVEAFEIDSASEAYLSYVEQAAAKLNKTVAFARFFDIVISYEDEKIEPKAAVQVKITYDTPFRMEDGQGIQQVHFVEENAGVAAVTLQAESTQSASADEIEVLDVTTNLTEGEISTVEFVQGSFSVTGTVVTELSQGWPSEEGYYAVIIKSGSKYYAVRAVKTGKYGTEGYQNVGALTEVTYDSATKKVTFKDISDVAELENYKWEYYTETEKEHNTKKTKSYLINGSYYIDPSNANGVSTSEQELQRSNQGNLYTASRSGNSYLTAENLTAKGQGTSSNAVQVFFAKDFAVTSSSGGQEGGSPGGSTSGSTSAEKDLGAPTTAKTLTSNNNGTYELSLSVTGKSEAQTSRTKADVIIVFDRSGSMVDSDNNVEGKTRSKIAIDATKTLVTELLKNNTTQNPDTVRIGVVGFHKTAEILLNLTNNKEQINTVVTETRLKGEKGKATNWQHALQTVSAVTGGRSEAKKYVIFVSDGNPTRYGTDGNGTNADGTENPTSIRYSYDAAKGYAKQIVDSGAEFYTVGVFGNVNRMTSLTAYAYFGSDIAKYPTGHYQSASNSTALTNAFTNIINEINKNFAYTDVTITDGITALTSTASIEGSAGNFTYSIKNASGATQEVPEQIKTATYDTETGNVVWPLGEDYKLQDGWTYTVSFTVWPKQQAYDTIAALENGTIQWKDESATVNEQKVDWSYFVREGSAGSYTYKYKTNTSAKVEYKQINTNANTNESTTSELKRSPINADPDMLLTNGRITVQKIWDDADDTSKRPESIELRVMQGDSETDQKKEFATITLTSGSATTEGGKTVWTGSVSVAPGLIVDGNTLENGHYYTIEEPAGGYYKLESANTIHPMLVNSATEIKNNNDRVVLIATNKLILQKIMLKKVDAADTTEALDGAVFKLMYKKDVDGTYEQIDGKDALQVTKAGLELGNLAVGYYQLTEIKAPDGYIISSAPIEFQVTESGVSLVGDPNKQNASIASESSEYVITVTNTAGVALPNTGGSGTQLYTLSGLLLLAVAMMYGLVLRRRREGGIYG